MRLVSLLLAIALCLGPASNAQAAVTVVRGPVNIRSGPGTNHTIISTAREGQSFEDRGRSGEWFKIKLADGRDGFVHLSLVRHETPVAQNTIVITNSAMNVRSGPGTEYSIVGKTTASAIFPVTHMSDKWAKITFGTTTGYVASWLCTVKALESSEFKAGDVPRKVVALKSIPVRRGASENFDTVVTLRQGIQADYLSSSDGWHRIRTASGALGWVDATDVRVFNVDAGHGVSYEVQDGIWEMRVNPTGAANGTVNVRSQASTSSSIVGTLSRGQRFTVTGTVNGWHRIESGRLSGYVAGWLVSLEPVKGPGIVRLERKADSRVLSVTGQFPVASLATFDANTLGIVVAPRAGTKGSLEVYTGEIGSLQIGQAGVMVSLTETPFYKVIESKPGVLRIEFSSSVESLAYATGVQGSKTSVTIGHLGFISPEASFDAAQGLLTLRIPGAALRGAQTLPGNGPVQSVIASHNAQNTTVSFKITAGSQYNLRKSANRLTVDVLSRGLAGKTILMDPGHGGSDPGAIGPTGLHEKQPNLEISLTLKRLLESRGAKVILTRSTDAEGPTLSDRVKLTLDSQSDLFVSIHNNSNTNRSKSGTSVYFAESSLNSERSGAVARLLQSSLVRALGRQDLGVKCAEFYVCRNSPVAAVVAEIVFVSNPEEEMKLKDPAFLASAAQALFDGLRQYFSD